MTLKKLIGSDANQVPTNGMLGTMAFQDANYVTVGNLLITTPSGATPALTCSGVISGGVSGLVLQGPLTILP